MSIFEKNLNYFKKNQPGLFELVKKTITAELELEPEITYEKQDGCYQAVCENTKCFIQSRYSVPQEIKNMFSSLSHNAEYILIFGFALGDSVKHALNKRNFPDLKSLIIVEPSLKWFKTAMSQVDFEEILAETSAEITLLAGLFSEEAGNAIAEKSISFKTSYLHACHLPVRTLFAGYYRKMITQIINQIRAGKMTLNSDRRILNEMIYNQVFNLTVPAGEFEFIKNLFKGKKVIIVSAGPSLEKNIHLLEQAKEKSIIIAAGTAIRILDDRGIVPHFRMAMDPWPAEARIFCNLKNEEVPLIYPDLLYAEIAQNYSGLRIRLFTVYNNIGQMLRKQKKLPISPFATGSSVGNYAALMACQSGCEKVVFMGQDMCLYDGRIHADTAEDEYYKELQLVEPHNFLHLKDILGNDVISPLNYYLSKESLEDMVKCFNSEVEFINSTEGGLGIIGAVEKKFSEVLSSWEKDDPQPVIDEYLKDIQKIDFRHELCGWLKKLDKITDLNIKNIERLQKAKKILVKSYKPKERDKLIKIFREAEKTGQKLKEIDLYDQCVEPDIATILHTTYEYWAKNLDSKDEILKLRSILELQLQTAEQVEKYIDVVSKALRDADIEEIKVKIFSLKVS